MFWANNNIPGRPDILLILVKNKSMKSFKTIRLGRTACNAALLHTFNHRAPHYGEAACDAKC